MNRIISIIIFTCLVLGFQNCSQSDMKLASTTGNDVSVAMPDGASDAGSGSTQAPLVSLDKVSHIETPYGTDSGLSAQSGLSSGRLVLALSTGVISLVDEMQVTLEKRCMKAADLAEVKTLLAAAKVCEVATPVDADQLCTARYQQGYASLFSSGVRIQLGESLDGCGTGKKDLCGDYAQLFKGFVEHFVNNWDSMSCE